MEVKAKVSYLRISPTKVRLVVNLLRHLPVSQALDQLKFTNRRAARPLAKLIKSCLANAGHNYQLTENNLYIKKLTVDQGPTLSRWRPRAHGRAAPIRKRSSHINLVLAEIKPTAKPKGGKPTITPPIKMTEKPKEEMEAKIKPAPAKDQAIGRKGKKEEPPKEISQPMREGRAGHAKIEGASHRGFVSRLFRRKSG